MAEKCLKGMAYEIRKIKLTMLPSSWNKTKEIYKF